jgi:hypothetical protein
MNLRRDPVALPDGCDLHESPTRGVTVVIPPAAQARMIARDPKAAPRVTIPWAVLLASNQGQTRSANNQNDKIGEKS